MNDFQVNRLKYYSRKLYCALCKITWAAKVVWDKKNACPLREKLMLEIFVAARPILQYVTSIVNVKNLSTLYIDIYSIMLSF